MKNCWNIMLLLLTTNLAFSQAQAVMRRAEIQIGEQTELIYSLPVPHKNSKVSYVPKNGKIDTRKQATAGALTSTQSGYLEIAGKFSDSIYKQGKKYTWIGKYAVTAWDTGYFEIPPTELVFDDSTYRLNAVLLHVSAPAREAGRDIYDIEESFTDYPDDPFYWLRHNYGWLILIALLLLTAFVIYRNKRQPKTEPDQSMTLQQTTLLAIDALHKSRLWERGQTKEHYIELSFILRSYLGIRYSLNLLEKTSHETTLLLTQQGLEKDTIQTIRLILDQSDLVKFAQSAPAELEILTISALAKQVVAETSPLILNDAD